MGELSSSADPASLTSQVAHPWGVKWPGSPDYRTEKVDTKNLSKAFNLWNTYTPLQYYWAEMGPEFSRAYGQWRQPAHKRPEYVIPDDKLTNEGKIHQTVFKALTK